MQREGAPSQLHQGSSREAGGSEGDSPHPPTRRPHLAVRKQSAPQTATRTQSKAISSSRSGGRDSGLCAAAWCSRARWGKASQGHTLYPGPYRANACLGSCLVSRAPVCLLEGGRRGESGGADAEHAAM